jgi:inositol-1,4,5-trisphosphate 5-phosphatase
MCEYSNDASLNLDCLDSMDDILSVDKSKRLISAGIGKKQKSLRRDELEGESDQVELVGQRYGLTVDPEQARATTTTTGHNAAKFLGNKLSNSNPDPSSSQQQQQHEQQQQQQNSYATEKIEQTNSGQMSWRNDNLITCMLITANVGTIFEESTLLELWFQQLKSYLIKIKPQLVAIHCQEVGGKNYETSMNNVSNFTDKILGDQTIIGDYSRVRIFLDENFQCLEKFTALGSLYLIHDSVGDVKLYNFKTAQYDLVEGRNIFAVSDKDDLPTTETNNTSSKVTERQKCKQKTNLADHVEKVKFPQELFPECRWSRKGFMRTRWLFHDCQLLDLANIHLFHDASNLVAMRATPSPYAQTRQKALEYALERISAPLETNSYSSNNNISIEGDEQVPLFIFGDFNFRLDTNRVVQRITEGVRPVVKKSSDSDEVLEFVYHRKTSSVTRSDCECEKQRCSKRVNSDNGDLDLQKDDSNCNYIGGDGGVVMTVGKKLFDCENLDEMFRASKNTEWLLELDNELDSFKNILHEFKISFSPSYPFKEDETGGYSYMKTRCPSWCDRILFNSAGNRIIYGKNLDANEPLDNEKRIALLQSQGDVIYRLMGNSVPMGDHKPVLLYCQLRLCQKNFN